MKTPVKEATFLKFAEWVYRPEICDTEIGFRCSISRAYYSIFHETRKRLMFDGTKHRDVIERLKQNDDALGSELLKLFKKRNEADYDIRHSISRKKAEDYITECKEFIRDLGEMELTRL